MKIILAFLPLLKASCVSKACRPEVPAPGLEEEDFPQKPLAPLGIFQDGPPSFTRDPIALEKEPMRFVNLTAAAYCETATADKCLHLRETGWAELKEVAVVPGPDLKALIFTSSSTQEIVVSFRGSVSKQNWIINKDTAWVHYTGHPGAKVHRGFYTAAAQINDKIIPLVHALLAENAQQKLVVTGHSLGGALAVFAALELSKLTDHISLYTYGQPRVGNSDFAKYYSTRKITTVRVTNQGDPVPHTPLHSKGFVHIKHELMLTPTSAVVCAEEAGEFESPNCKLDEVLPVVVSSHYDYWDVAFMMTTLSPMEFIETLWFMIPAIIFHSV